MKIYLKLVRMNHLVLLICLRPVDRIIGEMIMPQIEDYSYLKHFDISSWVKLVKKGKQAWHNIRKMAAQCPQMTIDTDEVFHDGNYCLYQVLEKINWYACL